MKARLASNSLHASTSPKCWDDRCEEPLQGVLQEGTCPLNPSLLSVPQLLGMGPQCVIAVYRLFLMETLGIWGH